MGFKKVIFESDNFNIISRLPQDIGMLYETFMKGRNIVKAGLALLVILMLWLYFCMYVLLLGGEINVLIMQHLDIEN